MKYADFLKPNFEVNYWLTHFRGLRGEYSRAYEAYVMQPVANSMMFADTTTYYDDDFIDCSDVVDLGYPPDVPFDFVEYDEPEEEIIEICEDEEESE